MTPAAELPDRVVVRTRLVAAGVNDTDADVWLDAWEASGPEPDGSDFWRRGLAWILEQRALRDGHHRL
jgi:rhamnogalacturonyl hydrolase YesR